MMLLENPNLTWAKRKSFRGALSATLVACGIAIKFQPTWPFCGKCSHLQYNRGVLMLRFQFSDYADLYNDRKFCIGELVHLQVLPAHYEESPYRSGRRVISLICMVTREQTVFSPPGSLYRTNILRGAPRPAGAPSVPLFPRAFLKKRLGLKSLKRPTKAEELDTRNN